MRKPLFHFLAFILPLALTLPMAVSAQETQRQYLSGHGKDDAVPWNFFCTTGAQSGFWTNLPVPSNWEPHGFGHLNYRKDPTNAWDEIGVYEHNFAVPANWSGQRIFLVFDGVMTDTSAKLNGQSVGATHQGGYYRFKYEVTPLVKFGATNKLEVTVAKHSANQSVNGAERNADFWMFGGIYRPVYLEAVPPQFIERVAIDARADGTFAMDVFLNGVTNADSVEGQIETLDGKNVGEPFKLTLTASPKSESSNLKSQIPNPLQWTAETPNLYSIEVRLKRGNEVLHVYRQRFGFRTMEVRDGDGLYVNGRKVILKGINRHSFWPDSGRCLSEAVHRLDIETMKDANINAVRMSHYPPDTQFLDLCDERGLYVLDELTGWHKHYDDEVGKKLVEEMVARDVNHPCILFWDNGDEGGFNTNLDKIFGEFDPQQRRVLHPWASFNGLCTAHYLAFDKAEIAAGGQSVYYHKNQELVATNDSTHYIYMPTEFMHGLYDGGAGAGLEDYWDMMMSHTNCAGGFIWAFTDDGLKRPDTGQIDTAGNQAPDGIVGPYRQREASFYVIKEIWSPILVVPDATGALAVENHFNFTDANQCRFTWQLRRFSSPNEKAGFTVIAEGKTDVPSIPPGDVGPLDFKVPAVWTNADALAVRVQDPNNHELWTWVWPMSGAKRFAQLAESNLNPQPVSATESEHALEIKAGDFAVTISKDTGLLLKVVRGVQIFSLGTGPCLSAGGVILTNLEHKPDATGYAVTSTYDGDLKSVSWHVRSNGWLRCDYKYTVSGTNDFIGVLFNYPENLVKYKRWLGDGPYRVWKNRRCGVMFGVWENDYNNTITGWRDWIYPEFKGCFSNVRWLELETTEGPITIVPDNIPFVQVLTPEQPPDNLVRNTKVNLPQCGLALLDGIPAIGSSTKEATALGPQSQPNIANGEYSGSVSFYFGKLP